MSESFLALVKFGKTLLCFLKLILDSVGIGRSFPLQEQIVQAVFNLSKPLTHRCAAPFGRRLQIGVGEAAPSFFVGGRSPGLPPVPQGPSRRDDGCNRASQGGKCVLQVGRQRGEGRRTKGYPKGQGVAPCALSLRLIRSVRGGDQPLPQRFNALTVSLNLQFVRRLASKSKLLLQCVFPSLGCNQQAGNFLTALNALRIQGWGQLVVVELRDCVTNRRLRRGQFLFGVFALNGFLPNALQTRIVGIDLLGIGAGLLQSGALKFDLMRC